MKYIPYALILVSFALGYLGFPYFLIAVMALASAAILSAARRKQLKNQPQAPDQNMILDGAFLLVQQLLIHFVVFALGLFLARMIAG